MLYLSIYKVESLKYLGENNFQEVWKKKWGNMRERERERRICQLPTHHWTLTISFFVFFPLAATSQPH